jgi:hypothetical protein
MKSGCQQQGRKSPCALERLPLKTFRYPEDEKETPKTLLEYKIIKCIDLVNVQFATDYRTLAPQILTGSLHQLRV